MLALRREVRVKVNRIRIHRHQREPGIVEVGDRAAGPMPEALSDGEIFKIVAHCATLQVDLTSAPGRIIKGCDACQPGFTLNALNATKAMNVGRRRWCRGESDPFIFSQTAFDSDDKGPSAA